MEHENDSDANNHWNNTQEPRKKPGELEIFGKVEIILTTHCWDRVE